jgi:hypothetical protein
MGKLRYHPTVADSRTHAIRALQYVLCDPSGKPLSLHAQFDGALCAFVKSRKWIILDEADREAYFAVMVGRNYSIRKCYAWVRVDQEAITKLPPEKKPRR